MESQRSGAGRDASVLRHDGLRSKGSYMGPSYGHLPPLKGGLLGCTGYIRGL